MELLSVLNSFMKYIQGMFLFSSLIFICSVARSFHMYVEIGMEMLMFLLVCANAAMAAKIGNPWIAYVLFVIAIFYNPIFLIGLSMQHYPIADISVGLLFFLISLYWHEKPAVYGT